YYKIISTKIIHYPVKSKSLWFFYQVITFYEERNTPYRPHIQVSLGRTHEVKRVMSRMKVHLGDESKQKRLFIIKKGSK
ncbi:MAG: hypothetical protein R2738_10570, partial [Bacteroides graminisolvens]